MVLHRFFGCGTFGLVPELVALCLKSLDLKTVPTKSTGTAMRFFRFLPLDTIALDLKSIHQDVVEV